MAFKAKGALPNVKIVYRICLTLIVLSTAATALAQKNYTDGPIWRVVHVRILPGKANAFWADLNTNAKKLWETEKAQGIVVDYKVYVHTTADSAQDWDVAYAIEYKNWAAIDGLTAKTEAIAEQVAGGADARQTLVDKRVQTSEVVSSQILKEVTLK